MRTVIAEPGVVCREQLDDQVSGLSEMGVHLFLVSGRVAGRFIAGMLRTTIAVVH
jgi:hypothetical protein